jgi:two-component system sensor histidine kinase TctE
MLTVTDSGPGISAEQRLRLFQPFASNGPRHGSGLGLAICGEIVQSLQGRSDLDNLPNETQHDVGATAPITGLQVRAFLPAAPIGLASTDNPA